MLRKKLVKVGGRYVERYVDEGPSRARPGHDAGLRRGSVGSSGAIMVTRTDNRADKLA